MHIDYTAERLITREQFVGILQRSTLAERRPVDDPRCIDAMLRYADILCTAWHGEMLVGVARSVTDFHFCCYLSDLAVDSAYQRKGIGRELIRLTQSRLGAKAQIILLAAPGARDYYPRIGFHRHESAWLIPSDRILT